MYEENQIGVSGKKSISPPFIAFFGWGLLGTYPFTAAFAAALAAVSLPQNFRLVGAIVLFLGIGIFPATKIWKSTRFISRNWLKRLLKCYVILGLTVTFVGPIIAIAFLVQITGQAHTFNFAPHLVVNDKYEIDRALVSLEQDFEHAVVDPTEVILSATYNRSSFLEDEYQRDLIFRTSPKRTEELLSKIERFEYGYGKPDLMSDLNLTPEIDCNELGISHYCSQGLFETATMHTKRGTEVDKASFLVFEPSTGIFWYQQLNW